MREISSYFLRLYNIKVLYLKNNICFDSEKEKK